jgi:hypothetical protein
MAGPGQCFISYSHDDHDFFDRLLVHLKPVAHLYRFELWYDRRIRAGNYWSDRIEAEIAKSEIFVSVATNGFFGSDYIIKHELPAMLARHRDANALFVPVIFRESCWRAFFGDYIEVVPKNTKHDLVPVVEWRDREKALAVTANAISAAIEDWFSVKPAPVLAAPAPPPAGAP